MTPSHVCGDDASHHVELSQAALAFASRADIRPATIVGRLVDLLMND